MTKVTNRLKLGRRTFRYKFFLISSTAAVIGLVLLLTGGILSRYVIGGYQHFDRRIDPIKYQLLSVSANASQYVAYQQAYLQTADATLQEPLQFLRDKVKSRLAIVAAHADTLNDARFIVYVDQLTDAYDQLLLSGDQLAQNGAENNADLQLKLVNQLDVLAEVSKETNTYIFKNHQKEGYSDIMESLSGLQQLIVGLLAVLSIGFYLVIRHTRRFIRTEITTLEQELTELSRGNLPAKLTDPQNELSPISRHINVLLENLKNVKEFSLRVGQNDFDTDISVFNNEGELGTALAGMRQSLKEVSQEDKQRNWVNTGLAQFLGIIRDHSSSGELSYQVLSNLVKYVGANQGGIFLVNTENARTTLTLEACFAYDRRKHIEKRLEPGQGLVGQAYLEQEKIYLKEVPKQYTKITSGLGLSTPRTILVQPLKVNEEVMGVLELASFNDFAPHVQEFIEKVSESVASALSNARITQGNEKILSEQRTLAEQLRSQEEELRQNSEELLATQEEMERRIRELETENERLRSAEVSA